MNSFGRIFRLTVFGESHGEALGVVLDGVLPGIVLDPADFESDLARRRAGAAGTTPRRERDLPELVSGVFQGRTTGAPLTILFRNENSQSNDYEALRATPRPGHADFVAAHKFSGFEDYRGGGHFSGRLTLLLVAAGVVAKKMLPKYRITATLLEVGGSADIESAIARAVTQQDSIGGVVECCVEGLPIGLGEPFFDSLESVLAHALFSIPAIKGVEFGAGFMAARMRGSEHNDSIVNADGLTQTNHAGGIVGGISNGNDLVLRVAVKPTSSTPQLQETYNKVSGKVEPFQVKGRHDLCIALRVPVVVEAVVACVLADMLRIHTGGSTL